MCNIYQIYINFLLKFYSYGNKKTTKAATSAVIPQNQLKSTVPWVTEANLEQLLKDIDKIRQEMRVDMQNEALTTAERRRLRGSGVRRYGFIDKVSDVAEANPEFAPPFCC